MPAGLTSTQLGSGILDGLSHMEKGALAVERRLASRDTGLEGSIVASKVREAKDKEFGFNAQTETYENLITAGVIDPVKVVRSALQNAASIA